MFLTQLVACGPKVVQGCFFFVGCKNQQCLAYLLSLTVGGDNPYI